MKNVISVSLMILFLVTGLASAAQKEKIAVAANDKTPSAAASRQAGLAPFFLFLTGKER